MRKKVHYLCPVCQNMEDRNRSVCECGHAFTSDDLLTGEALLRYRSLRTVHNLIAGVYAGVLLLVLLFLLYHFIIRKIAQGPWEILFFCLMTAVGAAILAGAVAVILFFVRRHKQRQQENLKS